MRQLFPTPVDDVSVAETYAADARPAPSDRPWVMANMISSVDGAIEVAGVSGGLGGPGDKEVFSAIRGVPDYILVGSGTVIAENYRRPQTSPAQQAVRTARGQRPLPQIVIVSGAFAAGFISFVADLVDRGRLDQVFYDLSLPTGACGVAAATVVAWFHGEKGKQEASVLEWMLLSVIAVIWIAVSAWIVVGQG